MEIDIPARRFSWLLYEHGWTRRIMKRPGKALDPIIVRNEILETADQHDDQSISERKLRQMPAAERRSLLVRSTSVIP